MAINVKTKGASGEREVCDMLNFIIYQVMGELGYSKEECLKGLKSVQRNQNQSAVGGNDLVGTFGLSIEVKRQEQLAVNTWWKQCEAAAKRNNEVPVLMYRQNNKPWRVVTYGWIPLNNGRQTQARVEFDIDFFKTWFRMWVLAAFANGATIRT